jgi:hypothetical protein
LEELVALVQEEALVEWEVLVGSVRVQVLEE